MSLEGLWVLAAAGGGSSGFGGGGGGGGGGFSGGGGSGGGGGGGGGGWLFVLFGAVIVVVWLVGFLRVRRARAARRARHAQTVLASREAAEDDAHFAADAVVEDARRLFGEVQEAWDARDAAALGRLADADVLREWELRLRDFASKGWHNRVRVLDEPVVSFVGLRNEDDDREDRVVVHVECRVEDYVVARGGQVVTREGEDDREVVLREYWTLAWDGAGRWRVRSIESDAEGRHNLDAPLVPSPWSDEGRLHDEALVEAAVADAVPAGTAVAELVDVDLVADARVAALDLSLVDARFAPDVLATAVRRVVRGWAEAVDGPDEALLAVAAPAAAHALLYDDPAATQRVVVRGATVTAVRIERLDVGREPARMEVTASLRGRRYVEDRSTAAVLAGSRDRESTTTQGLVLALDGPPDAPWRLVQVRWA